MDENEYHRLLGIFTHNSMCIERNLRKLLELDVDEDENTLGKLINKIQFSITDHKFEELKIFKEYRNHIIHRIIDENFDEELINFLNKKVQFCHQLNNMLINEIKLKNK